MANESDDHGGVVLVVSAAAQHTVKVAALCGHWTVIQNLLHINFSVHLTPNVGSIIKLPRIMYSKHVSFECSVVSLVPYKECVTVITFKTPILLRIKY